ncbi:hypothetical protein [Cytobacillus massiliigabonensis]|uniref:hypothetical protein n=1 Tax=Cytobacillus massiliigabonensis TaxID=1871011 RepID=UPI000C83DB2D|nr:hypothetical protein [Cytobacillus massiliigabonensis]
MKQLVSVILLAIFIVLISSYFFSNDFSNIIKVEYQRYNHTDGSFSKVVEIEEDDTISKLIKILNKANHQSTVYEKEYHEDFKLTLFYENETTETIRIWLDFGQEYDLLESETREGTYKLKNSKSREALLEILN